MRGSNSLWKVDRFRHDEYKTNIPDNRQTPIIKITRMGWGGCVDSNYIWKPPYKSTTPPPPDRELSLATAKTKYILHDINQHIYFINVAITAIWLRRVNLCRYVPSYQILAIKRWKYTHTIIQHVLWLDIVFGDILVTTIVRVLCDLKMRGMCNICNVIFNGKDELTDHLLTIHAAYLIEHKLCPSKFVTENGSLTII